jgi:hypothetical protein
VTVGNPFEKHGITHLSPTSINAFAAQPSFWAFKYLLKNKDQVGPSAWRGSAVEAGLDHWLFKGDEIGAMKAAAIRFELEAQGEIAPDIDKERATINPMLDQAMTAMEDAYSDIPTVRQLDIEYWIDGIEVPIIGKIDYEWPEYGLDLKTTRRIQTAIPDGHGRQISLYQAARKKPYKLLYVSEKKAEFKELTQEAYERHLKHFAWYAHNIRRGLATFSDPVELARLYPPDFTSFYWKNDDSVNKAMEIWQCQ